MGDKGMEQLLERLVSMLADRQSPQAAPDSTPSIDGPTNSISEFSCDPENGITFKSCKYLGFIFNDSGRHPDSENIRAIQQMPTPKDVPSLRSFLGLISYYSAFLPSIHDVRPSLNHLLRKDVPWVWSNECEAAFCQHKSMLSSDLLLTHYDPSLPIVAAAYASAKGTGAVIVHVFLDGTENAIIHASRSPTKTEQRHRQIENNAIALIFAIRRFHKPHL
ncbi:unnamed protein product [Mesocestoides corti]|uniref:RT_RNaseH_2 domain-containing protein n=1 Tax=Mesocestoides corti TaxID=53468 RepID=A0A0R3UC88_MESCO|nr:unnamed protein product [Mesocestoides corti]